jgi:hypothetical protein
MKITLNSAFGTYFYGVGFNLKSTIHTGLRAASRAAAFALFFPLLLTLGCGKNDSSCCPELPSEEVDDAMNIWRLPFEVTGEGEDIPYSNDGVVTINKHSEFFIGGIDCLGDGVNSNCELKTTALEFVSPYVEEEYYLTITLLPHTRLIVNMEIGGGIGTEIFRKIMPDGTLEEDWPSYYSTTYLTSYQYNGESVEGFLIDFYADERPPFIYHPPKKVLLLAGYGVVEWMDYEGNTFLLY